MKDRDGKWFNYLMVALWVLIAFSILSGCTTQPALVNFEYVKQNPLKYDCLKPLPELRQPIYLRIEPGVVEANNEGRKLLQNYRGIQECLKSMR